MDDHTDDGTLASVPEPRSPSQSRPGTFSPTEVIEFGWTTFKREPISAIVALIYLIAVAIIPAVMGALKQVVLMGMTSAGWSEGAYDPGVQAIGFMVTSIGFDLVSALINTAPMAYMTLGLTTYVLHVVRGHRGDVSMLFQPLDRFGPMWVAILISTVATWIGTCVFCIGALVAIIVLQFTPYFVVDRRMGGVDASSRSVSLAFANMGPVLLLWLLSLLVGVLGLAACGVGILVAMPVIWFALARAYLLLTGDDPSEVARVF